MSRILTLFLIAFVIYIFIAINADAKAEIIRATTDIPVKIAHVIRGIGENIQETN